MADLSRLLYPETPPTPDVFLEALRANVTPEMALTLEDRLRDAEQLWRFFKHRDEMNAEIHRESDRLSVRYSPITLAAERVAGYLARLYYDPSTELVYGTHIHPAGD